MDSSYSPQAWRPPPLRAGVRILVAAREPTVGELVQEALQAEGYELTESCGAEELAELARAQPWDLLILTGLGSEAEPTDQRLLTYLRKLSGFAPLIVMTARPWASKMRPEELGVAGILPKPVALDHLYDLVESLT